MPEIAEIHRFSNTINKKCEGLIFDRFDCPSNNPKFTSFQMQGPSKISAVARGKELELTVGTLKYCWNHGLVGKWIFHPKSQPAPYPQIQFVGPHDFVLSYCDAQKMGRMRPGTFDQTRSADPIHDHHGFCQNVLANLHKAPFQAQVCEVLLDQKYFNGVGNYIRAEALHRAGISPFEKAATVFEKAKELFPTFDFKTINVNSDRGLILLYLCKAIPEEVIAKDLDKYGNPEQIKEFEKWMRIYGKGSTKDIGGRKIHYSEKPLSVPDLPELDSAKGAFAPPQSASVAPSFSTSAPSFASFTPTFSVTPSFAIPSFSTTAPSFDINPTFSATPAAPKPAASSYASVFTIPAPTPLSNPSYDIPSFSTPAVSIAPSFDLNAPAPSYTTPVFEAPTHPYDIPTHSYDIPASAPIHATPAVKKNTIAILPTDVQIILDKGLPPIGTLLLLNSHINSRALLPKDKTKHRPALGPLPTGPSSKDSSGPKKAGKSETKPEKKEKPQATRMKTTPKQAPLTSFFEVKEPKKGSVSAPLPFLGPASALGRPRRECWKEFLSQELNAPYFKQIMNFVATERTKHQIYPKEQDVFAAFDATPLDNVKVVIIGQDPYFNEGQANGLCFSVSPGVAVPPSLKRIFTVLTKQIPGFTIPKDGDLTKWAQQGVLLLNATLTVESGKPNSHAHCGWQKFTDAVISLLNSKKKGLVFMLWGGFAQKKGVVIGKHHHILTHSHPSPLSGNTWDSCRHFSECNEILGKQGQQAIDWKL